MGSLDRPLVSFTPSGTYVRTGGCEPGCGLVCCQFLVLPIDPRVRAHPRYEDWKHWVELHGLTLVEDGGELLVRINIPCSALTEDGLCSLYGKPDRPKLCDRFPRQPGDLVGLEGQCKYRFTKVEEGETPADTMQRIAREEVRRQSRPDGVT